MSVLPVPTLPTDQPLAYGEHRFPRVDLATFPTAAARS